MIFLLSVICSWKQDIPSLQFCYQIGSIVRFCFLPHVFVVQCDVSKHITQKEILVTATKSRKTMKYKKHSTILFKMVHLSLIHIQMCIRDSPYTVCGYEKKCSMKAVSSCLATNNSGEPVSQVTGSRRLTSTRDGREQWRASPAGLNFYLKCENRKASRLSTFYPAGWDHKTRGPQIKYLTVNSDKVTN